MPDDEKHADEQSATDAATEDATTGTEEATDWKSKFETEREHSRTWEKRAKENKDAAAKLKEVEDADKSEIEKANERAEAAEKRAQEIESAAKVADLAAKKVVIGAKAGLPAEWFDRLKGDDEESITADAEALAKSLNATGTTFDLGQGTRGTGKAASDDPLRDAIAAKVGLTTR